MVSTPVSWRLGGDLYLRRLYTVLTPSRAQRGVSRREREYSALRERAGPLYTSYSGPHQEAKRLSVCLSVCLSVESSIHNLDNSPGGKPDFPNIYLIYMHPLIPYSSIVSRFVILPTIPCFLSVPADVERVRCLKSRASPSRIDRPGITHLGGKSAQQEVDLYLIG